MGHLKPYGMSDGARICPATTEGNPALPSPNTVGSAFQWWGPNNPSAHDPTTGTGSTGSYGMNGWLYRLGVPRPSGDNSDARARQFAGQTTGLSPAQLDARFFSLPTSGSAEIPVFSDCIWPDGWPTETPTVAPSNVFFPSHNGPNQIHRFVIPRHGKGVNVAFLDGHAEHVQLPNLWTLRWHAVWETPANLPIIP